MRSTIGMAALACALLSTPVLGQEGVDAAALGCDYGALQHGWEVIDGQRVFNEGRNFRAVAYKADTPVFKTASDETRNDRTLRFSEYVIITDPGEGAQRIEVSDMAGQPVGWLNRNEVLCRRYPMRDRESGLYRRAVVRTATDVQGQAHEKEVFHTLDGRCEDSCPKVSRFQWYFIYAEIGGFFLISEQANLGHPAKRLLGWLPVKDALNWNTAVGLRPGEELADRRGPNNEQEDYVCVYSTKEVIGDRDAQCNEILGGKRWFNLDVRMAVLKQHSNSYEVGFTNAFRHADQIGPDPTAILNPMSRVDVFFVIDGTKSMQPAIDGVKKIVESLRERVKSKVEQGGVIRFGFRVYRDSARGGGEDKDGVGNSESLVLSGSCDRTNEEEFLAEFGKVRAYEPAADNDFPENLFGGLAQASADMEACPDHTKLVFVIGDHGYDPAEQRRRGFRPPEEGQIIRRFKKGERVNTQPMVFFVQIPSEVTRVPSVARRRYGEAYERFKQQGLAILRGIYKNTEIESGDEYFIRLTADSISNAVIESTVDQVDSYLRPDVLAEVGARMRAGQSLVEVIEALRQDSSLNIPIRYLQFVETSVCERLGRRCRESVLESVNVAFVPPSDDIVPEVMIPHEDIDKWVRILEKFKGAMEVMLTARTQRALVINALLHDVGTILHIDVPNTREELGKFLQFQAGLPHAASSTLLQYSPYDLKDRQKVPLCEIEFLIHYASRKHDVLKIVKQGAGRVMPTFGESEFPERQCPRMSDKGKKIPFIKGVVRPRRLNDRRGETNFTFLRSRGGQQFYWLPVRYLP